MYINKATFDIDLTMGNISTCIQLGHTDKLINDQSKAGPVPHDILAFNYKLVTSSLWVPEWINGPTETVLILFICVQISSHAWYSYKNGIKERPLDSQGGGGAV